MRGMRPMATVRSPASRAWTIALGCAASLALLVLYSPWIREPSVRYDDFNFLTKSRTWHEAFANVWQPMNDHAMPLSRLAAAVLMSVVTRPSRIPLAAELQGVLAVILGMWLLYAFVRRELGQPLYGLIAMTAWGVTAAYYECVTWYSASFFILSLDMTLLGLLAAQAWRRTKRARCLLLSGLWCALAPAWYGGGILAGLFCAAYLLPLWKDEPTALAPAPTPRRAMAAALAPLAGSVAFLAVSLPRTAEAIIHAGHYQGRTVFEAFNLRVGAENTLRTLADNQVLGAFGVYNKSMAFSWPVVLAVVGVLVVAAAIWWRLAPHRRLLLVGLTMVLGTDLLVYSARADWSYVRQVHNWTRYHLFPHLGLVLFVAGGLSRFEGRWFRFAPDGALSRRQVLIVTLLIAGSLACHLPRSRASHFYFGEQGDVLKRVERVDAQCRVEGISGETAREALGFLQFPLGYGGENAWDFLRGSSTPKPLTVDEAYAILRNVR